MNVRWIERWKHEEVIGLDVQYGHIVASHFTATKTGSALKQLAVGTYDPQATDREIARSIRELWKKEKLPTRTVRSCLHSRALVVRYFRYENLDMDELPQALALEAEEALQQPMGKISMDWQLNSTEQSTADSSHELSGTLVAAPRKTVHRHLNLIKAAGLYSISVETSCCALSNLYSFLTRNQESTPVCLINLTERTADIIMHSDGSNYPRTLFSAGEPWEGNMEYLLENIQNAILYYHLKLKHPPIERIFLMGRIPKPDELPRKLSQETVLPVNILNLDSNSGLTRETFQWDKIKPKHCNLATGIGLGLRRTDDELG